MRLRRRAGGLVVVAARTRAEREDGAEEQDRRARRTEKCEHAELLAAREKERGVAPRGTRPTHGARTWFPPCAAPPGCGGVEGTYPVRPPRAPRAPRSAREARRPASMEVGGP